MQKGNIGVTTENIFPIIKKFLYSDHEIFLRELVSNAVDATQKLKTYASKGDFKGEMGDLTVKVNVNKETITISDRGIGMTAEDLVLTITPRPAYHSLYQAEKPRPSSLRIFALIDLQGLPGPPLGFTLRLGGR